MLPLARAGAVCEAAVTHPRDPWREGRALAALVLLGVPILLFTIYLCLCFLLGDAIRFVAARVKGTRCAP